VPPGGSPLSQEPLTSHDPTVTLKPVGVFLDVARPSTWYNSFLILTVVLKPRGKPSGMIPSIVMVMRGM
jgi:hypothetical protein